MTIDPKYSTYSAEVQPAKSHRGLFLLVSFIFGFAAGSFWVVQTKPQMLVDSAAKSQLDEAKMQLTLLTSQNLELQKKLSIATTSQTPLAFPAADQTGANDTNSLPPTPGSSTEVWQEIKRFSGSDGKRQTEPFVLSQPEARFKIQPKPTAEFGSYLGITVKQMPNRYVKLIYNKANADVRNPEDIPFNQSGEFYLDVSSNHTDWEIVVEVKK